jgi:flavin-dependent dehydrogenase
LNPLRSIEIIGGGLAGLSLASALRQRAIPVTVIEAGGYPRHRVCGEFITGLSETTAARLGLEPFLRDALAHREVAWFVGQRLVRRQHLPAPARAISRYVLDARLATALEQIGGQLCVHTRGPDEEADGRIFATGRCRSASPWLGLKIHALNFPLHADLELHLGADAYIGLTRIEGGRVNICGLFRRRAIAAKGAALIVAYLRAADLTGLAGQLAEASFQADSFCAVAAVGFDSRVIDRSRVTVGDACAMTPPFTGNGMAMAFQSAEAALDPLLDYAHGQSDWAHTKQAIHRALARRFRVRLATATWLHPFLLRPPRQRWTGRLARAGLLPWRPLHALLH